MCQTTREFNQRWDAMHKADRCERLVMWLFIMLIAAVGGVGAWVLLDGLLRPLINALGGGQ